MRRREVRSHEPGSLDRLYTGPLWGYEYLYKNPLLGRRSRARAELGALVGGGREVKTTKLAGAFVTRLTREVGNFEKY